MEGFFTTNFMGNDTSPAADPKQFQTLKNGQSAQGQLSSQYTTALYNLLSSNDTLADYVGFLAKTTVSGTTLAEAKAVADAVAAGSFSLSDLFAAAQSKTGAVSGANMGDPAPMLTVNIGTADAPHYVTVNLTPMMDGLDTETWTFTEVNGSGKKATTTTTYHTREFYTDTKTPDGYTDDWKDEAPPPPPNTAPVSGDDVAETDEDTPINGDLTDNASDADGDDLTYVLTDADGNEIDAPDGLTWNGDGTWSFDPSGDYESLDDDTAPGTVTFYYKVNDGTEDSNVSSVVITIKGANDAPTVVAAEVAGTEDDASIGGTVPAATDVDDSAFTYKLVSGSVMVDDEPAVDGTITFASGTYSYTPTLADQALDDGESKVITFSYVANDGTADSAPATVTITVNGVNDAPEVQPIYATAMETLSTYSTAHAITNQSLPTDSSTKTIDLLQGASDVDEETLSVNDLQFFDKDGNPIDMPGYVSVVGNSIVIEQNSPLLNYLLDGQKLNISVEYDVSDGTDETPNVAYIEITGTKDQYHASGSDSVSATHYRSDSTTGNGQINNNVLAVDEDDLPTGFDFSFDGSVTFYQDGLEPKAPGKGGSNAETGLLSDQTPVDWGSAVHLDSDTPVSGIPVDLVAGALDDGEVNYNVTLNTDDGADSVTVTLNYTYDYWYYA